MNRKHLIQLVTFIVMVEAMFFYLFSQVTSASDENGLFENLQVLVLLIGFLASTIAVFSFKRDDVDEGLSRKIIGFGFVALALSFVIRELDFRGVEGFEPDDILVLITSGTGSRLLTLVFWMPFFIYIAFNRPVFKRVVIKYWRSEHFWKMTIVVAILIFSDLVEHGVVPLKPTTFFEESLELVAYTLFAWNVSKIKTLTFRQL